MHHAAPVFIFIIVAFFIALAASSSGPSRTVVYRSRKVISREESEDEV